MGIIYNEKARTFTLHTHNTTYQMQIDAYGFLLHLYYGRKTDGVMDYLLTYADRGFSGNPQDAGNDRTYSLDVLPQEFPCRLTGDFRSPVLDLVNADGSFGCDLRYQGYEICDGKYNLNGASGSLCCRRGSPDSDHLYERSGDRITGRITFWSSSGV